MSITVLDISIMYNLPTPACVRENGIEHYSAKDDISIPFLKYAGYVSDYYIEGTGGGGGGEGIDTLQSNTI